MTAKKDSPAKRGRKPAPKGAKLQQISVRLPPSQLVALDLIGRATALSLSQVVELGVVKLIREYEIDGTKVAQLLDEVLRPYPDVPELNTPDARAETMFHDIFAERLPDRLRKPAEKLFVSCKAEFLEKHPKADPFLRKPGTLLSIKLFRICEEAIRSGLSRKEIEEQFLDHVNNLESIGSLD